MEALLVNKKYMRIIKWFLESSVDATKLSLTLKGILSFLVVMGIDASLLDGLSSNITDLIVLIGQLITVIITLSGFARKLALTFKK